MSSLILKNKHLVGLAGWLSELSLSGRQSRERTRFVNSLVERIKENEEERKKLVDKYCEKDENGKNKTKEVDGIAVWDMTEDNIKKYTGEYTELLNEGFVIDILESNKERIDMVKDIILNTEYKFGPQESTPASEKEAKIRQAHDYHEWCEAFESIE